MFYTICAYSTNYRVKRSEYSTNYSQREQSTTTCEIRGLDFDLYYTEHNVRRNIDLTFH